MLEPGTVLGGRYRIEAMIGRGGMAEVYRAYQPTLSRHVAVKIMRGASEQDALRFEQEAVSLGRLSHRCAVVAHDHGSFEDPKGRTRPFIVMELLTGETLRQRLDRAGRLPPDVARHVAREIGECIAAAHDVGVIHRDLKPTNIMLVDAPRRALPEVRVLDFGIAKIFAPNRVSLSAEGELVGSPRYMAPEQFEDTKIDHRVDIWTFGLVLHEMLVGGHPLPPRAPFKEVLAWMKGETLPKQGDVPPDLQRVIERCTARQPEERPHSMDAVLDLLGHPSQGHGRRGIAIGVGLLVLVSLLVGWMLTLD
ncbi:MAG: serine/threonine protein kinase [Deltaproteobacteria bacterium]|nr:serine/threonine protein kinase [Deltaproteobacteria bacterium]